MAADFEDSQNWRFGAFEVEGRTAELRRNGVTVRLQEQPSQLLLYLLQHAGEIVTRENLRAQLWPANTFVDFDHALNTAVMKLREALGDSSEKPLYIQTVPRKGYRFVAPVSTLPGNNGRGTVTLGAGAPPLEDMASRDYDKLPQTIHDGSADQPSRVLFGWKVGIVVGMAVLLAAACLWWKSLPPVPVVNGITQLTDDGNPKLLTDVLSDGARVYFNEVQVGTKVIAQVATVGGETGLVNSAVPGASLAALASDSSHLLVLGDTFPYAPMWILPLPVGEPRNLAGNLVQSATFFPDGSVAFTKDNALYVAEGDGSNPHKLSEFPGRVSNPILSLDGKRIRLTVWRDWLMGSIWEVNSNGSDAHPLLPSWLNKFDASCGRWTADGQYFVFQSRRQGRTDIWALADNKSWFRGSSAPFQLTNGPLSYELPFPSPDGEHIYTVGLKQRGELVRFDTKSQQLVPYLSGLSATDVTVSRDGKWVTYQSYPDRSLWRSRTDGSERLKLTYSPTYAYYPRISPDGTKVAYGSVDPDGKVYAYVLSLDGGEPRKIADRAGFGVNWSPDSNSLIQNITSDSGIGPNFLGIRTIDLRTGKMTFIPNSVEKGGAWWPSPDLLVSAMAEGGDWKFVTFDFKTKKWLDLTKGPLDRWATSVDGEYLYYTTGNVDHKLMRVRFSDRKVETVASLNNFRPVEDQDFGSWIGVAQDGSPLLTRDIGTDEIYDISLHKQ
jgi:DNA-binding winged helix-turn-helix (wHTH) protein/Tol biopolymer transport system component